MTTHETTIEPATVPGDEDVPRINVTTLRDGVAPGLLLMSQQSIFEPWAARGPQIADDRGRPVWFLPLAEGQYATNVRVQEYQGRPVLTWWQGEPTMTGVGMGTCYIADTAYRVIATVRAGGDQPVDLHEFLLTERGTAVIVSYQTKPCDLSGIGGSAAGRVIDSVVEEIDVATGEVLLHWSGLEHIPIEESDVPVVIAGDGPWDHLHVNSVAVDDDGDLVVTARASQAVYKIDRRTGAVRWKLGSGYSTFTLGVGVRFNWPHDAQPVGNGVYRVFDNGANVGMLGYESRVVWVRVDAGTGTASYVKQLTHPEHLSAAVEGSSVELPNGNTLISWGSAGRISEFSPDGRLVFDAESPQGKGWSTYRVYRQEWHGRPDTPPEARIADGMVHAVWNGATGVARWRLLAGPAETPLREADTVPWDGLDTPVKLPDEAAFVQVEALDAENSVLAASPVVPVHA
ncbi:arylsulfotransferase family protein [Actinomadura sp. 1N219]|uniref:arylsulfotransferase family protein n=1 Tax=Actinomadura sp. 1N219 TaxID=3375152 RepID=UPI00379ED1DC